MHNSFVYPISAWRRLLKVQPGEGERVLFMFLYSLAAIGGVVILGRSVSRTLFLSTLPETATPYKYILPPFFVVATTFIYTRISGRYRLPRLTIGTNLLMVGGLLLCRLLLSFSNTFFVLAVVFVYVEIMVSLVGIQFWTTAAEIFDPREARRLFGLIAAGGVLANALTGAGLRAAAHLLLPRDLLFIVAASLLAGVGCVWRLSRSWPEAPRRAPTMVDAPQKIRQSPLLITIGGIMIIMSLVTNIADYQLDLSLQRFFAGNAVDMLRFLGLFQIFAGLAAVAVQLFVTNRVLSRLGLVTALLLLPAGLLLGSSAFLVTGGALWAMALPRGVDTVFRYTVNDAAVNILFMPIPAALRRRAKAVLDGIVKPPIVGVLGIIFLLVMRDDIDQVGVQARDVVAWSGVIIGLVLVWLLLVRQARQQYMAALTSSLRQRFLDLTAAAIDITEETTRQVLLAALAETNTLRVIHALQLMLQAPAVDWRPQVRPLLKHEDPYVRQLAITHLSRTDMPPAADYAAALKDCLRDPEPDVQAGALRGLIALNAMPAIAFLQPYLDAPALPVRVAAIHGLIQTAGIDGVLTAAQPLKALFDSPQPEQRQAGARLLGDLAIETFYQPLLPLFVDPVPTVQRTAIAAAGRVGHAALIDPLLGRLEDPRTSAAAAAALAAQGPPVIAALQECLDRPAPIVAREQVPEILVRVGTGQALQLLVTLLDDAHPVIRREALAGLTRWQAQGKPVPVAAPRLQTLLFDEVHHFLSLVVLQADFTASELGPLLTEIVATRQSEALERIFYLLILLYPSQPVARAQAALREADSRARATALELLDTLLERPVRSWVLPLLEAAPAGRLALAETTFTHQHLTPAEHLALLAGDENEWTRACALWQIGALHLAGLTPVLQNALASGTQLVQETAGRALARLAAPALLKSEAGMALSTIERVLILRGNEFFRQFGSEELVFVAGVCSETHFSAGTQFITQGEIGDSMYVLVEGEAEVILDGVGPIFRRVRQDIIGEMAIISRRPRSAHCIALTDITALRISHDHFWHLMAQQPDLALAVIKVLSDRLDEVVGKLAANGSAVQV